MFQTFYNAYASGLLLWCIGGAGAIAVGGVIVLAKKWMAG